MLRPLAGIAIGALALLLSGCAYDYLQHTDRVGYSAGDAVKANLEAETIDPAVSKSTKGLGKNGNVMPPPTTDPTAPQ